MNGWKPLDIERNIKIFKYKSLEIAYKYYNRNRDQKTILFLYGFGANILMADQFAPVLAGYGYTVLTIDYPGHGYSPKVRSVTLEIIVEALIELLKHLKENRIILAGYSFGGIISLLFYREYKSNIDGFVLIHSSYYFKKDKFKKIVFNIFEFLLERYYGFAIKHIAIPVLRDFYFTNKQINDARSTAMLNDRESVLNMFKLIINKNMYEVLNKITCPSLVIGSCIDILVSPFTSKKICREIKNCRLKIFKTLGHYSVMSMSEKPGEIIDDFLRNS